MSDSNARVVDARETAAVFQQAREQAGGKDLDSDFEGIDRAVIQFERVTNFTTFVAEYAFVDGDIVIHFFPPREHFEESLVNGQLRINPDHLRFWKRGFPQVLSPVAERHFNATMPRLKAAYSDEMTSWWFRAYGFAANPPGIQTPEELTEQFFVVLDQSVDVARAASAPGSAR